MTTVVLPLVGADLGCERPTQATLVLVVGDRPLTPREREVLDVFLGTAFRGADRIRRGIDELRVTGTCGCGCPTIYFDHPEKGLGAGIAAQAAVRGTHDTILLFTYVWVSEHPPSVFPDGSDLDAAAE